MATSNERPRPIVLAILDGWGVAPQSPGNALTRAKTPHLNHLVRTYPALTIKASGEEVGLSWGEVGNSEVGHLNIGAGRVWYQTFPRINKEIASKTFFQNQALIAAIEHVKRHRSQLHLVGMVSSGNVHSADSHLYALLDLIKMRRLEQSVFVHAILDGRDTLYNSGANFISTLESYMKEHKIGKIATLIGRWYAMDRDNRWDRTEAAFRAIAEASAPRRASNSGVALKASYKQQNFDEEFIPTVIARYGKPMTKLGTNDAIIFLNFRSDRMRQLTESFVNPNFSRFARTIPRNVVAVTFTEYEKSFPVAVAFPETAVSTCLTKVISDAGLTQLHIAETEKYAHITYFINGMTEDSYPGEQRVLIPSPKVTSYDQKPGMSASALGERVVKEINQGKYDVYMINFANADMVAHTGNLEATVAGAEAIDREIGHIVTATLAKGGVVLITADHGNGEEVVNLQTNEIDKEHSTNPVPFVIVGKEFEGRQIASVDALEGDLSLVPPAGALSDVAPTMLKILGLEQPPEMIGRPLI